MLKRRILSLVFILMAGVMYGQDNTLFAKKVFYHGGDSMPYRLLLPKDYDPAKKYPLILFLHGAGERGNDNQRQLIHGSKLFILENTRNNFPAIVLLPQCSETGYWSNQVEEAGGKRIFDLRRPATKDMQIVMLLLNKIIKEYPVKKKQVYVGGLSMGGMGTFEIVARQPKRFAAAFPICGGSDPSAASKMSKTSWWIFHGEKDDVVWPFYSKQMATALTKAGAKVKLTLYPEANHNSWDRAFAEPGLLPWLFAQHK